MNYVMKISYRRACIFKRQKTTSRRLVTIRYEQRTSRPVVTLQHSFQRKTHDITCSRHEAGKKYYSRIKYRYERIIYRNSTDPLFKSRTINKHRIFLDFLHAADSKLNKFPIIIIIILLLKIENATI